MIESRSTLSHRALMLAMALLFTVFCYRLARNPLQWEPELGTVNWLYKLRGPREVRKDFVIVAVNNQKRRMLDRKGEPDRHQLASLIRKAKAGGARAIVLDVYLPNRTSHEADRDLWLAIAKAGNVFLPGMYLPERGNVLSQDDIRNLRYLEESVLTGDISRYGPPPPDYTFWKFQPPVSDFTHSAAGQAGGVGVAPYEVDPDGILRRVRLTYQTDIVYPPTAHASRLILQGNVNDVAVPSIVLPVASYVVKMDKRYIVTNYNRSVNFAGDLNPPIRIPVDEAGRMMVNYVGPIGTFPYVQAAEVLNGKVQEKQFDGKVVFIGLTEGDKADFHATPYTPKSPRVDITANAVATVLDRKYVTQSSADSWVHLGFLALFLALTFPFFTALGATVWGVVCLVGYTALAWLTFRSGTYGLLPILPAYLLIVLMWIGSLASRPFTLVRRAVYA